MATASAYHRDVKHLVDVSLQVLFWLTPVVYDLADVPARVRLPLLFTPVSPFVTAMHDMFYRQVWPDVWVWTAAVLWSLRVFRRGLTTFLSFEDRFAEQL